MNPKYTLVLVPTNYVLLGKSSNYWNQMCSWEFWIFVSNIPYLTLYIYFIRIYSLFDYTYLYDPESNVNLVGISQCLSVRTLFFAVFLVFFFLFDFNFPGNHVFKWITNRHFFFFFYVVFSLPLFASACAATASLVRKKFHTCNDADNNKVPKNKK